MKWEIFCAGVICCGATVGTEILFQQVMEEIAVNQIKCASSECKPTNIPGPAACVIFVYRHSQEF